MHDVCSVIIVHNTNIESNYMNNNVFFLFEYFLLFNESCNVKKINQVNAAKLFL